MTLQEKYGVVQTYQATTSTEQLLKQSRSNHGSVLNAPYLGSLSRSANQVLSLPPMSLAGGSMFGNDTTEEPPETITNYGSLRDSHQRGQFLDGPQSYREPTSGRIRQLDHRLRYHAATRSSEISIGERLQQSRKLKEVRQQQQAKKDDGAAATTAVTDGSSSDQKSSGLSAIMNEATNNTSSGDEVNTDTTSSYGEEILMPVKTGGDDYETPTFRDNDSSMMTDSPSMLSTSLTAFEMLKQTNVPVAMSLGTAAIAAPANVAVLAPSQPAADLGDDQRRFLPLARSMSDPTPQMRQLSLRADAAATRQDLSQNAATAAATASGMGYNPHTAMQMMPLQQYPAAANVFGYATQPPPATAAEHDPDTDGAFGDMDL
ncbi:MAG: hypothetical protein SGARI_003000 [Bacillariaceae sp.]